MECNRGEAARAKLIAESKLEQRDYAVALRFAQKAQTLDPTLHGISKTVATLDVLVAAQKTINGEVDWYSVLRVDPTSDDDTIKRQYKRLALLTHPDKNPYAAADTAFKLISEAKNLLLDTERRQAHDLITACGPPQPEPNPARTDAPSATPPTQPNWPFPGPNRPPPPAAKRSRVGGAQPMPTGSVPPVEDMFWTFCHHCRVRFEYLRIFQNTVLVCANCRGTFTSFEIPRPVGKSRLHGPQPWVGPSEDGSIPAAWHTGLNSFAYAVYKRKPLFGMGHHAAGGSSGGARPSGPAGTEGQFERQTMGFF